MAVWSLDGANVDVGGSQIGGFGETDAFSYKRVADRWDPVDCCDGGTVHNQILTTRGEMTFTLRYGSTSHRTFKTHADAGDTFSVTVTLANGRVIESQEARVLKDPEPSFGSKTGDEVWTLSCVPLRVTYEQGGA